MLTINYEIDPQIIESIAQRELTSKRINKQLTNYLKQFETEYTNVTHKGYVEMFICGLLSNLDRKSIEPIALHFGGANAVRSLQNFFSRAPFNTEGVKRKYQELVLSELSDEQGMICVDESDFVKKGENSPGVARQYCGRLGKRENCQAAVFVAYSGETGHGLLDNKLYIPEKWFSDEYAAKRKQAKMPENLEFKTKNRMAAEMVNNAFSSLHIKAKWVGCDASFGSDHGFLDSLPDNVYYFASVRKNEKIYLSMPDMILSEKAGQGGKRREHPAFDPVYVETVSKDENIPWEKVFLADSAKGPIYADTKCIRCVSTRAKFSGASGRTRLIVPGNEVWLYIRKHANGEVKYFISNAPSDIAREELNKACVMRWPIEQCFEECKSYFGMAHYETTAYCAWERHMLFVMMAHFFTAKLQIHLKKDPAV